MTRAFVLIFIALTLSQIVFAATLQEICNSKDVLACRYMGKLTLMDLKTGDEADVYTDDTLLDFTWNKAGTKLYALSSVYTEGLKYEDPGYTTIIIRSISLPSGQASVLTQFKVKDPLEDNYYSFSDIHLNKDANLAIVLTYGSGDYVQWQYTYNFTTAKLSTPVKKDFVPPRDGYKRKGLPPVTNQDGKYYNKESYGDYDLFTIDEYGYEINVSKLELTHWGTIATAEPISYCIAPDSSFLLFGYNTNEDEPYGPTYAADGVGGNPVPISFDKMLGYDFEPYWISGGRLVYFYKSPSTFDHEKTSVNILGSNAEVTVIKTYESQYSGPQDVMYRYQSQ